MSADSQLSVMNSTIHPLCFQAYAIFVSANQETREEGVKCCTDRKDDLSRIRARQHDIAVRDCMGEHISDVEMQQRHFFVGDIE